MTPLPVVSSPPAAGRGRARWHRSVNLLPIAYLAAIAAVSIVHPLLPQWRWLLVHLLLLGAAGNAILIWTTHFAAAVLRVPADPRRAEATRLVLLNLGIGGVLAAGTVGTGWLGVTGSLAIFIAVLAHLWALATRLRRSLPARFAVTVHYYLAAAIAVLVGVPVGGWMLVDSAHRDRLVLFHAHVNLLGWVTLTVLGTLLTLWPTVLRTRMAGSTVPAAIVALPLAVSGLVQLGIGLLAWWPTMAVLGLVLFAAAVVAVAAPAVAVAWRRPPSSFAAWSIAAGLGWLLVALVWDVRLLAAADAGIARDGFHTVLSPLLVGFVGQVLIGALAHLLPMALGGGPSAVRANAAALDRYGPQRVVTANLALAIFLMPVGAYVRITASLLVLGTLLQFLLAALRLLVAARVPRVAPPPAAATGPHRVGQPWRGVSAGLVLVLVAVLAGTIAERAAGPTVPDASPAAANIGRTSTVAVAIRGMRYHPDRIEVPRGDRLIIEVVNDDDRDHDLVLATGPRTPRIRRGAAVRLDAGVVDTAIDGWCSLPGHRQQGMVLTVVPIDAAAPAGPREIPRNPEEHGDVQSD
ncbi:MAG TPA: cupredoxin domain-containing protein [Micromonosporaceae bacterium]